MGFPEGKEQKKGAIYKEMIAEDFLSLRRELDI